MSICCYCERPITREHVSAVSIAITALWTKQSPSQEMFAHASCLTEKFAPSLSQSVPFDADAFGE